MFNSFFFFFLFVQYHSMYFFKIIQRHCFHVFSLIQLNIWILRNINIDLLIEVLQDRVFILIFFFLLCKEEVGRILLYSNGVVRIRILLLYSNGVVRIINNCIFTMNALFLFGISFMLWIITYGFVILVLKHFNFSN